VTLAWLPIRVFGSVRMSACSVSKSRVRASVGLSDNACRYGGEVLCGVSAALGPGAPEVYFVDLWEMLFSGMRADADETDIDRLDQNLAAMAGRT
jgi:hypothetical protein